MHADAPTLAGSIAGILFVVAQLPMIAKVLRTRSVSSYSGLHLALGTVGNLLYWLYVRSLPFGPVWLIHVWMTLSTAIMLYCWVRWRR